MSVPASVPKRSGRHLLRRFSRSGIRNRDSYSSNSTTSPIFLRAIGQALLVRGDRIRQIDLELIRATEQVSC